MPLWDILNAIRTLLIAYNPDFKTLADLFDKFTNAFIDKITVIIARVDNRVQENEYKIAELEREIAELKQQINGIHTRSVSSDS